MADRPILFSAPMVQAILEGRKTQTRRLVKFPPHDMAGFDFQFLYDKPDGLLQASFKRRDPEPTIQFVSGRTPCAPGDTLWVREAWRVGANNDPIAPRDLDHERGMTIAYEAGGSRAHEAVGGPYRNSDASFTTADWIGRLRASMHMPRWASRISLGVTDVRVERLNDCSEADALAEGLIEYEPTDEDPAEFAYVDGGSIWNNPVSAYRALWDHINGHGAWAANPLVWVISFERVTP